MSDAEEPTTGQLEVEALLDLLRETVCPLTERYEREFKEREMERFRRIYLTLAAKYENEEKPI